MTDLAWVRQHLEKNPHAVLPVEREVLEHLVAELVAARSAVPQPEVLAFRPVTTPR